MTEKRNRLRETAQLDLFIQARVQSDGAGVGARQAAGGYADHGGGYQEMCGTQNFGAPVTDPRLDELKRLGLPRAWLLIAETVGFDAWMEVWRRLSSAEFNEWVRRDTGGTRMPTLRSYDSYLRYQRNRYIEALAARGMGVKAVAKAVAKNLREPLDESHVAKIMHRKAK